MEIKNTGMIEIDSNIIHEKPSNWIISPTKGIKNGNCEVPPKRMSNETCANTETDASTGNRISFFPNKK